jgi:hypothetical protein
MFVGQYLFSAALLALGFVVSLRVARPAALTTMAMAGE